MGNTRSEPNNLIIIYLTHFLRIGFYNVSLTFRAFIGYTFFFEKQTFLLLILQNVRQMTTPYTINTDSWKIFSALYGKSRKID